MPFPGLVPNRVVWSAFPSPSVSRNARTPPPGDWSATNTSPFGATAMSRVLAGAPVRVLASNTTRAQKPPGRFKPPLSGSQAGRVARPGAAIPWVAWAGPAGRALAPTQATSAATRGTTARTLGWTRMRPPRSRDAVPLVEQEFDRRGTKRCDAHDVPTRPTRGQGVRAQGPGSCRRRERRGVALEPAPGDSDVVALNDAFSWSNPFSAPVSSEVASRRRGFAWSSR